MDFRYRPIRRSVIGFFLLFLIAATAQAASVTFQYPANGSTVSGPGNIELRLAIDDPNNEIRSVEYEVPGIRQPAQGILVSSVPIGTSSQAPFTFVWPNVYGPVRKVTATARNAAGEAIAGAITQFTVTGSPSVLPTVSLVTPQNNDVFSQNQVFEFRASAHATHGISCVEFQEARVVTPIVFPPMRLASVCSPPYRVNWSSAERRELRVQARVMDRLGNVTDSEIADITIGNQRPTVSIQSPANNSPVIPGATVTVTAIANDLDGNLRHVEFRSGPTTHSVLYGRDDTYPYTVAVTAQQGSMTVYARAYDSYDLESLPASVTLVEATPPSVAITTPAPNTALIAPASVVYEATATAASGSIAKVEFFDGTDMAGGRLVGQATPITGTNRFTFHWNSVPVGVYPIRAKATSTTGAWKLSEYNYLFVNAPNQVPTITLASPAHGATYALPATLALSAQATDADGTVERVEFYRNGGAAPIASVPRLQATGSMFSANWPVPAAGTHVITAKAFDNTGMASAPSSGATVTVTAAVARETVHYFHSDAQGSIVAVTDQQGQRVNATRYRPFGQTVPGTGAASPTRIGYAGKLRDDDLQLVYFGARHYDPLYGRFISIDPADISRDNLHSFNRYAYANSSPLNFADADGRESPCFAARQGCGIWKIDYDTPEAQATIGALFAAPAIASGGVGLVSHGLRARVMSFLISRAVALENGVVATELAYSMSTGAMAPNVAPALGATLAARAYADTMQPARRAVATVAAGAARDGTVFLGHSGIRNIPWTKEMMELIKLAPDYIRMHRNWLNCAETYCMNAISATGRPLAGVFMSPAYRVRAAGNPQHGTLIHACEVCQWFMNAADVQYLRFP